ncbi:MAG: hypothetical protein K2Z80_34840 [Xanthobacteraceae bacterium]|nr:hypothetical protein [Xanthobacteraceae bacterium]
MLNILMNAIEAMDAVGVDTEPGDPEPATAVRHRAAGDAREQKFAGGAASVRFVAMVPNTSARDGRSRARRQPPAARDTSVFGVVISMAATDPGSAPAMYLT